MKSQHTRILDREHLAHLYQRYAPKMLTYVSRQVASSQDAEDILIDVFVAALESVTFTSLSEQEQQAWLWRVARNKIVDSYRKERGARHLPLREIDEQMLEDRMPGPEQLNIQQEEGSKLALLLEKLPPFQQRVLYLRFGENLRCTEIAVRTGKRESSIRALLSRTLKLIRERYYEQETREN